MIVKPERKSSVIENDSAGSGFREGFSGEIGLDIMTKPKSLWQSLRHAANSTIFSIIGDADERTELFNTRNPPWRMICALEIEFDALASPRHGTGWLAGPNCIVTAGHCLFDHQDQLGDARAIKVYPGRFGKHEGADPFGNAEAVAFEVLDPWKANASRSHDLGAIRVDRFLGNELGWFAFGATAADAEPGIQLQSSAYSERLGQYALQLRSKGIVTGLAEGRLFYDLDTMPGGSGGPVMAGQSTGAKQRVVAVHAYDETAMLPPISAESNSGTWLDEALTAHIEAWATNWND